MSHFQSAYQKTVGIEGAYSNDPDDSGGETMYGITAAVARYHGYSGPMRLLPLEEARRIYRVDYWDPLRLDEVAALSPRVAEELFDTGVNFGAPAAGRFLQAALNGLGVFVRGRDTVGSLVADGQVGPATLTALRGYLDGKFHGASISAANRELVLLRLLNAQQGADYLRQVQAKPVKAKFLVGWILQRVQI